MTKTSRRSWMAISASLVGPFLLCYGVAGVVGNFASGALLSRSRSVRPVLAGLTVVLTAALLLIVLTQPRPLPRNCHLAPASAAWSG